MHWSNQRRASDSSQATSILNSNPLLTMKQGRLVYRFMILVLLLLGSSAGIYVALQKPQVISDDEASFRSMLNITGGLLMLSTTIPALFFSRIFIRRSLATSDPLPTRLIRYLVWKSVTGALIQSSGLFWAVVVYLTESFLGLAGVGFCFFGLLLTYPNLGEFVDAGLEFDPHSGDEFRAASDANTS